jgi:diguanylate cyclase (GGDEF)-like protein
MIPADSPEVLVVEDDPDMRAVLEDALSSFGFSVRTAATGSAGLAALRQGVPDLVLLDHGLPEMSGIEVCRQIRRDPALSAVPVVMLTARSLTADQVAGLDAGADDYVTKPFELDGLVARLRSHLRRSRRERQLNPLSGLPGNIAIEEAIEQRLEAGTPFAVAWVDLDNFKVYNDRYGFSAGDHAITATGKLLCRVLDEVDPGAGFAGHIGGDDFVLVTSLERAEQVGQRAVEEFDAAAPAWYSDEDRRRGFVVAISRTGEERSFPLMSVSISIVPCPPGRYLHPGEIAQDASEIKHFLKQRPGSGWLVDRRAR